MKNKLFAVLTLALFSSFSQQFSTAFAQGPAFTYQGFLTDGGAPANGVYDLQFNLFAVPSSGGAIAGPLLVNDLGITNGLFTVALDFGPSPFDGSDRWLNIAVRPGASSGAYTNLVPRQLLTATPYAVRAANFSGTVTASQITGTISSNNIGAGSITTVMLATGAVGSNQLATGAVTTGALADGAVTATKVATVSNWFPVTILRPPPANGDWFGYSVAAVGSDRILIGAFYDNTGAVDAGAAYLFSTNGTWLTTFTNPTPAYLDSFGNAVAAVGSDRVLIGAYRDDTGAESAGAAYLFSTNGTLLTTFTNPVPGIGDLFGYAVASFGNDRVLIGALDDNTGSGLAGATYLFSTNGTLLMSFTNPTPAPSDYFGCSVSAVGGDRVLIGAYGDDTDAVDAGAAYLFNTNGTLLMTFTNPTPATFDYFGYSVATVGGDRVLIGAHRDGTGAESAGAAYMFSTNGTLLTAFTNPFPAAGANFGISVAAVGSDRVLIGAYQDDTGAAAAGAAYLFSTNGTLLMTFTNPTPVTLDWFGYSVAALGSDRVLIGAHGDNTDLPDNGAAYLFSLDRFMEGLVADGVRANSIITASLEANAVTTEKLADGAVTTKKLVDGAVTAAKLDPSIGTWTRSSNNVFRSFGNVGIGTSIFTSNRLEVVGMVGAFAFNTASDRATKENFTPVDPQVVLAKVAALPITQWSFKELPGALHVGPMAQDFRAAFGLGYDEKHIATVDADGVALAAIQGLNQKLEQRLEQKETEITQLKQRLEKLERLVNGKNGGAE